MDVRTHFKKRYSKYTFPGRHQGCLDMTYFAVVPPSFKRRGLKIAIVFNHGAFRFEKWLAATNRQVQRKCLGLFRGTRWPQYQLVTPATGADSIVECGLAERSCFADLNTLTADMEKMAAKFTHDMERFLSRRPNESSA